MKRAYDRSAKCRTPRPPTCGRNPETKELTGGFTIVEVPLREAALEWAAKIAAACRCAQQVREFRFDPLA